MGCFRVKGLLKGAHGFKEGVHSTRPNLTADKPGGGWKVSIGLCSLENYVTLAVSSFNGMVNIETTIYWIQKQIWGEEDSLLKISHFSQTFG